MNKYFHFLFLTCLLNAPLVYGQYANNFEKAVLAALDSSHFYTYDDFFGAGPYDSLTIKDQFQFAEAARRMGAYGIAESAYARAVQLDSLEKKEYIPEARYWQGKMHKIQGNYQEALHHFEQFLDSAPPVSNEKLLQAKKDIQDCQFAIERMQNSDSYYTVNHLGGLVNSPYSDVAPLIIGDNLYYTSLKYEMKEDKVKPPRLFAKTLQTDLVSEGHPIADLNIDNKTVAHPAISPSGNRMYFTQCEYIGKSRKMNCSLCYRDKKKDGTWDVTQELPEHINTNGFTATQPTVGYDVAGNEVLYFVSNRPEGKGGFDIWYSKVLVEDFGPVKNHSLNTGRNDITPYYHVPSKTLYFSSDGRMGLGGYDIYSYTGGTDIDHEGYPLNSSFNDFHFTLNDTGETGYFSSNRQGCIRLNEAEKGCEDIFSVTYVKINLKVLAYDDSTKDDLLGATVTIQEMEGLDCSGEATTVFTETHQEDNSFLKPQLKRDTWYQIITTKEGYESDTTCISTNNINASTDILQKVYLQPSHLPLDLLALTFDENTKLALNNCIVQLEDQQTGELFIKDNSTGNDFNFPIYTNKEYCLIATSVGYASDTLCFNTNDLAEGTNLTKELFLEPNIQDLNKMLPLTLYFDNDYPDPKTWTTTTTSNYEDLFYPYYRKQAEFVVNYSNNKPTTEKESAEANIRRFFEEDLKYNYDTLGLFSEAMISYLRGGQQATISILGYASPLAQSDYNNRLSSRRVSCIMNHFRTYRNGVFQPYINSGQLTLQEVFYGENEAPDYIPDDPRDKSNSVYSPDASLQRKVEIVEVAIGSINN